MLMRCEKFIVCEESWYIDIWSHILFLKFISKETAWLQLHKFT